MAKFLFRTKGNADPAGKRKVYFTCHPEDFARCFDKVCEDIFRTHDCVIYYTEDMKEIIAEEDKATDLGQMNLFVVPVTFKLLSKPNRAMDSDIAYAKREHIPILPLMMETGIDEFYGRPDKFGELQYLNPYSNDISEIGYAEKMKKYLESVLISDEMAQRIRKAFDAYIFLSYRKKDRRYANELMKMIHNIPEYRDIAIWYDEFLTPGESFRQNIEKALQESKLFALLVTPNLLEESNFVMTEEYPSAKNADMMILPTEMVVTDKTELHEKYRDIPECAEPGKDSFRARFLDALEKAAITGSDHDPAHNFLIGLAYLDGIDMEIDRERGLVLITSAAEDGLVEAMEKLYEMYNDGKGIQVNYKEAVKWAGRIAEYHKERYGEEHSDTLITLSNLAVTYSKLGDYSKALELEEKVYASQCKILGEEHPSAMTTLSNLAYTYVEVGDYRKALELQEKVYALRCRSLGEEHPDTLITLSNLAVTYGKLGDYGKEAELEEKVYSLRCRILGEEHPSTLTTLSNLAATYGELGDYGKEAELGEKVYALRCGTLGEEHPDALNALSNLAVAYSELGEHQKALALKEKAYTLRCGILGEEHPDTLNTLSNLAVTYGKLGDYGKEAEVEERVYALRCRILGEEHPSTLKLLSNLAVTYGELGELGKEAESEEKIYALQSRIFGEEHPDTLNTLSNLAVTYSELGEHRKALALKEKVYAVRCKTLGEEHPDALIALSNLAVTYGKLGDCGKEAELEEKVYASRYRVLGEEHPSTLTALSNLAMTYGDLGEYRKALELERQVYILRCKILGEEHSQTLKSQNRLIEYLAKLREQSPSKKTSFWKKLFKK